MLYEPAWPHVVSSHTLTSLEELAAAGAWSDFAFTFFKDAILVPVHELEVLRDSSLWPPIVADAPASLGDLRALSRHTFTPENAARLAMPVLLQVGSESPRDLYVTDALAPVLAQASVQVLPGQAHEGMTTAPEMYADVVTRFFLGDTATPRDRLPGPM